MGDGNAAAAVRPVARQLVATQVAPRLLCPQPIHTQRRRAASSQHPLPEGAVELGLLKSPPQLLQHSHRLESQGGGGGGAAKGPQTK